MCFTVFHLPSARLQLQLKDIFLSRPNVSGSEIIAFMSVHAGTAMKWRNDEFVFALVRGACWFVFVPGGYSPI